MKPVFLLAALCAGVLVACGGGSPTTPPAGPPPGAHSDPEILAEQRDELAALPADVTVVAGAVPEQMPTRSAVRFLNQASFGAVETDVAGLRAAWRKGWLAQQQALPATGHWERVKAMQAAWLAEDTTRAAANLPNTLWDWSIWQAYITAPDQLRKRVGYALSQILVISMEGLGAGGANNPLLAAGYLDVLERGAFGNFRQLLEDVSLSPAMGMYLSHRGNRKAEYDSKGVATRVPDENYAREVMQLFTLGLAELNLDGTARIVNGVTKESYTEADVMNLARVFTGWDWQTTAVAGQERYRMPMRQISANHSLEEKRFLGVTIPAGTDGPAGLRIALDTLFNHPNVGPFIGRQLIQRLVTSNPSPAYVARVAARFNDSGSGVRGDMKAVLDQVLRDPEARTPLNVASPAPGWGKLREPVLRYTQLARALGVANTGGATPSWRVGSLSDPAGALGQSPLRSPSVFNFYRPGYVPPNTALANAGLVGPEFQITTDTSVPGIVNALQRFMAAPPRGMALDYAPELALATDATALVASIDLRLANQALAAATRNEISAAVAALPAATDAQRLNRVRSAWLMVLASPEYIAQK